MFRISVRLLWAGAAGTALIALLADDIKALAGALCMSLVTPALLWALRRGHARLAMTGAVSAVWLVACTEVVIGDGVRDVGMSLFTIVVLVSALLLDRRTSVAFSALSVLSVAAIGGAGMQGRLASPLARAMTVGELAILVFLLAMFAVLMHAVARVLYKGLHDAALHEQTYREIFNATSDAIFIIDEAQHGRIVDVNRAACALSGFSRAELLEKALADMARRDGYGEAWQILTERMQRASAHGLQVFEWRAARKDGSRMWLEVALHAATIRGRPRVLAAVRDISDRKAAAEQVRAAERLQALGQLAGGVAHDFNNQLTGIVSSATLLQEKLRDNAAAQLSLDLILQCSQRSADLTRQLLAFARKGDRREDLVDVESLMREVVSLLERSIDKRVTFALDVACSGARVIGDQSFLGSALVNLGLNAQDAMPQGGTLRYALQRVPEAELPERARAQMPRADTYVRVSVSDTGVGIAPDVLGHVFEPFFTTKAQGSGLGLSVAYGTMQAHGGAILVASELGVGTTFDLFLPAAEGPLQVERARPANRSKSRLRVLLAEDEPEVGRATELVLQELGCVVTWRRDGRAALEAVEREPDAFDVAILDHSMPRMLGSEVGERIEALCPRMWIIAISGFAEQAWSERDRRRRIFLPKPFGIEQLAAALDQTRDPSAEHAAHALL